MLTGCHSSATNPLRLIAAQCTAMPATGNRLKRYHVYPMSPDSFVTYLLGRS
jgi:hypothetical protein